MSYLMDQLLRDQMRLRGEVRPLPVGCDAQGRHITRCWPDSERPMAAEAATDMDDGISPQAGARIGLVLLIVSATAVLSALAVVLRYLPTTWPA